MENLSAKNFSGLFTIYGDYIVNASRNCTKFVYWLWRSEWIVQLNILALLVPYSAFEKTNQMAEKRERFERELCFPGFSSTMIRGPTLSESDRHLCKWDERIRRHSCQTFPRKAPYSHEERGAMLRFLIPSFHSLPMHGTPGTFWRPRTACILWPCFSYGSSRSNCSWTSCFSFVTTKDAVYIASRTCFRWYRLRLFNSGCNRVLVMDVA